MDSRGPMSGCSHLCDWILQENDRVSLKLLEKIRYEIIYFLLEVALFGHEGSGLEIARPKHVSKLLVNNVLQVCSN